MPSVALADKENKHGYQHTLGDASLTKIMKSDKSLVFASFFLSLIFLCFPTTDATAG
jgi:hypothetical protein